MLNDFWYAVEHSPAITRTPRAIALMGQEYVLYRMQAGQLVAVDNRCVHRRATLAAGTVEGDGIRCPYHGWKYGPDGACNEIPANQPGTAIPASARIRSYPLTEQYGLVWMFLGDRAKSVPPPLPTLPEFEDPGWRTVRGEFTWNGHYTRVIANTIDMAHAPFVHATAFGRKEAPRIQHYHTDGDGWGARATIHFKTKPAHFLKFILGSSSPDGSITSSFHLPNITQVYHQFGRVRFVLFMAHVPVSETVTHTKWLHLRNFAMVPWADRFMERDVLKTFVQDDSVVRLQPPGAIPECLSDELHAPSDALEIAYRRLRAQHLAGSTAEAHSEGKAVQAFASLSSRRE